MAQPLAHDIRLAARSLARSPGFVAACVLSLGLGIGGGIAGFSVLDAMRFRALPFPAADRLVLIGEVPKGGCANNNCSVDNKTFALIHEHTFQSVDAIAAFISGPKSLGTGENQVDVFATILSASGFAMLGAAPEHGRTYIADEDKLGAPATMVVGHKLWTEFFRGDTAAVGKVFMLSDEPFTLIGVMPPNFQFEGGSEVWLAASRYFDPRTGTSVRTSDVMARLAPGKTANDLLAELGTLQTEANAARPETARMTFGVRPLRDRYASTARLQDLVFAGIVAAILLIACANVAGLVLVRAIRNRRELAIRTALGADTAALARHLFAQNGLLAAGGLALGIVVGSLVISGLRASPTQIPKVRMPGLEFQLDGRAIAFAVALTAIVTLAISLAPLRLHAASALQQTLRENALSATIAGAGLRLQQVFVVLQTACAVALLVGTGLLVRTALRFSDVRLGYEPERVAYVTPIPAHAGRPMAKYMPFSDQLLLELAAMPGVEKAALRATVPFAFARQGEVPVVLLDDGTTPSRDLLPRSALGVSPDYFTALGIPLASGRAFTRTDDAQAPPVAIINEWAAQRWWAGKDPVGRTFTIDTAAGARATITVVGVVRDNMAAAGSLLLAKPRPEVYRPFKQASFWVATYYARTAAPNARLIDDMSKIVMRTVPNGKPNNGILAADLELQVASVRSNVAELAAFAAIGLLLAVTGLYGVLSYVVQQRTAEIGIRGVLGAQASSILAMVLGSAMKLAAVGVVLGLVAAALLVRFMQSLLRGTPPADPVVYAAVALLFLVVALAAAWFPARRATKVDPAIALRAG